MSGRERERREREREEREREREERERRESERERRERGEREERERITTEADSRGLPHEQGFNKLRQHLGLSKKTTNDQYEQISHSRITYNMEE